MGSKPRKKPVLRSSTPARNARKKQIHVPVTALDHEVMTARAAACGLATAAWARLVLRHMAGLESVAFQLDKPTTSVLSLICDNRAADRLIAIEVSPEELRAFDGAASRGLTARGTWARETLRKYAGL
jgi:hypothetical protein